MKAVLVISSILLLAGVAHAQPVDPYAQPRVMAPRAQGPLRAALLAKFDRDHDGRLDPVARRHAIRALRRLTRRLVRQQARERREARMLRGVIRKYDANGDGNVGPGEIPPNVARKLRRLDRNRDGWVDDADF